MKNLKFLLAFMWAVALSSCLDTEEKIVLNEDNSGTYSMTLDMGKMISMAASMGGDKADTEKEKEKKDTTVYLKEMVNAADNLTPEEKAIFQNAVISIKMDEAKSEMKIVMSSPFSDAAGLVEIKKNFATTVVNKLKAFEKASGEQPKAEEDGGEMKMDARSANPVDDQFTFKAGTGFISNSINNIQAFKDKIASDSTLGMMSQMKAIMGDINYRTIIVLPKAVKKFDGPNSTITDDRKTLHFVTTLTEMMEHPEKVSYKVEY